MIELWMWTSIEAWSQVIRVYICFGSDMAKEKNPFSKYDSIVGVCSLKTWHKNHGGFHCLLGQFTTTATKPQSVAPPFSGPSCLPCVTSTAWCWNERSLAPWATICREAKKLLMWCKQLPKSAWSSVRQMGLQHVSAMWSRPETLIAMPCMASSWRHPS